MRRWMRGACVLAVVVTVGACGGDDQAANAPEGALGSAPGAVTSAIGQAANAENPCPLTVEQVSAVTGAAMTQPPGGCTFFPASGGDVPHVFYILQVPMLCNTVKPADLGFTDPVPGLESAWVRDQVDGAHVLVCRPNRRAFDVVVNIRDVSSENREQAIALARQLTS